MDYEHDVIHAHDWLCYPAGIAAKEASGKPLVIHVHATDFDRSGGSVNPKVFEIEKMGMDAADKIITVSNLTRNIVIEKYGQNPDKVITVYNAVEPVSSEEKLAIKKGVKEKIVTFLGRITMQKGPEYFIEAAYQVLKRTKNVRFVMAGSGDMLEKMIERAAQLGIADKFHFTGFLKGDDVFKMFELSDVYVMPSVSEPFGISPLEAMQSNVPVIISKQSGVSEILTHAIKVDYWDIDAMADAIYGIINYNSLSTEFKIKGKEEVDNLKWANAALNVYEVYKSAIGSLSEK
jgi:glycosyltransferase involved in cell wall biosynthesis